ncbi:hypothetical protein CMUS01_02491 [Colletotrichum musicola]|uniref:Uncharacterized protein n=1 Tax=Colletotrichum musicola TaxID=2175873 RepID=A0A8H6U711_9PEZI|nr:hypothetical protein CMUS01_02491 [Colletotrichum musicola]
MDYAMRQGPLGALLAVGREVYVDAIAKVCVRGRGRAWPSLRRVV